MLPDSLPAELRQFVEHEVACGLYHSTDEVIAAGLRLLREQKLDQLRRDIDLGIAQIERGEGIELADEQAVDAFFEDIKTRGRQRLEAKRAVK
jgi:antitoxin ParD1/3/4